MSTDYVIHLKTAHFGKTVHFWYILSLWKANRGSPAIDKERFALLCEELRAGYEAEAAATGQERMLVTAAVAAGQATVETAYDIPRISAALDYIHIMAYDLHGGWENTLGHHSQVWNERTFSIDWKSAVFSKLNSVQCSSKWPIRNDFGYESCC